MKNKLIICLDFDGVIHSYTSGWQGARSIPDPPVAGAIEFMLDAVRNYDVVIHSSRARYWGGISAMRSWLRRHAGSLWYDTPAGPGLENVRFTRWKPLAVVTIDDRAIRFDGFFRRPEVVAAMLPWNKVPTGMIGEYEVAEGSIKEAEMRKQLLESARWYRQHVQDLERQLNKAMTRATPNPKQPAQ